MWGKIWLLLLLVAILAGCQHPIPAYESHYTGPESSTAAPASYPPFDVSTINQALSGDQPYVISVIGDSTGNAPDEWVHLIAERIAANYGRTVTVHDWEVVNNFNQYKPPFVYGSGPPVTIWNGSASGKPPTYSLQYYDQMAPVPVNLTIISHAHNQPQEAVRGVGMLVSRAYANSLPGGGVVVVLENARTDSLAGDVQSAIDQLRNVYANDPSVALIDVNTVFKGRPDLPDLLLPDGIHPNQKGSQVWAGVAASALQLR